MRLKATYEQRRAFQQAMSSMLKSIPEGGFSAESVSATIKTHCDAGLVFYVVSVSSTVPNPWASPFGGAESLAPLGAKDVAEPKGLAGAPG